MLSIQNSFIIFIFAFSLALSSCSHKRSKPIDPIVPEPQAAMMDANSGDSEMQTYQKAVEATLNEDFGRAKRLWKKLIDEFPASPKFKDALLEYGRILVKIGEFSAAIDVLRTVVESPTNYSQAIDSRLVYIEALNHLKKLDLAIALTFDMLPDSKEEKRLGIQRKNFKYHPLNNDRIRILSLRGWLYAELNRIPESAKVLDLARVLLSQIPKSERNEKLLLTSLVALRQLQTLNAICSTKVKLPENTSEVEFLEYASDYFACLEPAKGFVCDTQLAGAVPEFKKQAVETLKSMVMAPLKFTNPLPTPSRKLKPDQKTRYETDMVHLIRVTVEGYSVSFRNIEACNAVDIF